MHGLKRRGLETGHQPPRQSPTLLRAGGAAAGTGEWYCRSYPCGWRPVYCRGDDRISGGRGGIVDRGHLTFSA